MGKPADELAIVVRVARGEVEGAVCSDGSHRTRRDAELTFHTRVVVQRVLIRGYTDIHQHRAEQNEIAEFRMNHIAVNAHMAEPGGDRHGLMGHDPDLAGADLRHLHGKAHRRVNGAHASRFECGHDAVGRRVDALARVMEFHIRDRAGGIVNRLAVHAQDEADQGLGVGKEVQDIVPLIRKLRAINVNKADIVSAGCHTEGAELVRVEPWRLCSRQGSSSVSKPFHARMVRKWCHASSPPACLSAKSSALTTNQAYRLGRDAS